MQLKIVIADDEKDCLKAIKTVVSNCKDVKIVGEASDGVKALEICQQLEPDVVLIDIDMPGLNGLEVARKLMVIKPDLYCIFITNHPDFAIKAFEIYSFDYILKPLDNERLHTSLERIKKHKEERTKRVKPYTQGYPQKLLIKTGFDLVFINVADIILIEKINKKTIVFAIEGSFETYESINDLEKKISHPAFFRCHKSYLINIAYVKKLVHGNTTSLKAILAPNNLEAMVSRNNVNLLQKKLLTPGGDILANMV